MEVPVTLKLSALIRNVFTTENTERFSSFICREIPANERSVPACGARLRMERATFNRRMGSRLHTGQGPPKADEDLAQSRHLPRMGKVSFLCALCDSVVKTD